MVSHQAYYDSSRIQKTFMLVIAVTCFAAWVLAIFYHHFVKPISVDPTIIISYYRGGLSPKPEERFIFLMLLGLVSCLLFALGLRNGRQYDVTLSKSNNKIADWFPILVAITIFISLVGFGFNYSLIVKAPQFYKQQTMMWVGAIIASSFWCWIVVNFRLQISLNYQRAIGWLLFLAAMFLQIFAWRIFSEDSVTRSPEWTISLDAMLYALSQVVHGKTLLGDLPSQYGLFPEMMAPVFRLCGFSILRFTIFCAILQAISLAAIYTIVSKHVKDGAFKCLFGIALVMLTFETVLFTFNSHECYFQYWPTRFLWPALSVFAFSIYAKNPTFKSAAMVSLLGALGTVWNMDTGLMIVLAFGTFLIARAITLTFYPSFSRITLPRLLGATAQHVLIFILIIGLAYLYLRIKAHQPLHLAWVTEYQRIFYLFGFQMLRMPHHLSPWVAVLSVYAFGILTAVTGWARFPNSKRHDLIFFVSVLGLGIFIYYEGRSHILNLIAVCWPALFVAVLLADRTLRAVRAKLLSKTNVAFYIITLSVLILSSATFIANTPGMLASAMHAFKTRGIPDDAIVASELQFIKENTHPGESCLIYSLRQATYYVAAGLSSPIKGPGVIETLTTADFYQLVNAVKTDKLSCVFVGTGESIAPIADGLSLDSIFANYKIVGKSSSGTMLRLMPK